MNKRLYMIKKIICFWAIFVMAVALVGCEEEEEYVDKGLKAGFEVSANGDVSPSDYCAYSSDKSEFNIDNVMLEFSYGGFFNVSIENELKNGRNIPYVELYFINESSGKEPYLIRKTTDSYVSEEYRCKWLVDEDQDIIGIDYNHYERIAIPKELFIGGTGKISFLVFAKDINNTREPDYNGRYISGVDIFYKVNWEKVILSNKQY